MHFFNIDIEDIQLFDCAVVGKEFFYKDAQITSTAFACYNAGYWDNPLNSSSNTMFIDRTYLIFYDIAQYHLTTSSTIDNKTDVQQQFRFTNELDIHSYLEAKTDTVEVSGHIWGPIIAKKTLVALPKNHVKMYGDDSLIQTYKSSQNELDFVHGKEFDADHFWASLNRHIKE